MTSTTRQTASRSVNFTSRTDSRMDIERSYSMLSVIDGGGIGLELRQQRLDVVHHLDRVRARLPLNRQHNGALVVEPVRNLVVLHAVDDVAQLLQAAREIRCDTRRSAADTPPHRQVARWPAT